MVFTRKHVELMNLGGQKPSTQAWTRGTLAELELLGTYHHEQSEPPSPEELVARVVEHCKAIVDLMGMNSFHVASTRRQFQRYLDYWDRDMWRDIAAAAVEALRSASGESESELPPYVES